MYIRRFVVAFSVFALTLLSGCLSDAQEKQMRKLSKEKSALTAERNSLTQANADLIKQTKVLSASQAKLKAEMMAANKKMAKLEADLASQKQVVATAEQDRATASAKVTELESKLDVLQKKYQTLKTQADAKSANDPNAPLFHPGEEALVHYWRADGDYENWNIHIWDTGAAPATPWDKPKKFSGRDAFGAYAKIKLRSSANLYPVELVAYNGADQDGPHKKFMAVDVPEIWLVESKMDAYTNLEDAKKAKEEVAKASKSKAADVKPVGSATTPTAAPTPAPTPQPATETKPAGANESAPKSESKFGDVFSSSSAAPPPPAPTAPAPASKFADVEAVTTPAKVEATTAPAASVAVPAASKFSDVMTSSPTPDNAGASGSMAVKSAETATTATATTAPATVVTEPAAAEPPKKSAFGDVFDVAPAAGPATTPADATTTTTVKP